MNALMWKRRWYHARPWLMDGLAGVCLVAFMVGTFWLLDLGAAICRAKGYCA